MRGYGISISGCNLEKIVKKRIKISPQCEHKNPEGSIYCNVCGKKNITELYVNIEHLSGVIDIIEYNHESAWFDACHFYITNPDTEINYTLFKDINRDKYIIVFKIGNYKSNENTPENEDSHINMWNEIKQFKNYILSKLADSNIVATVTAGHVCIDHSTDPDAYD